MFEILPNFHPILVHFTVALFSVSTALFALVALGGERLPERLRDQCRIVARWNLWLAAAATILTLATGFHAYSTVAHDAPSHAAMSDHRDWAIATFILIEGLACWSIIRIRLRRPLSGAFMGALVVAQIILLSTAWRGGELVYRYGLGVLSLPASEAADHGHTYGDGSNHSNDLAEVIPTDTPATKISTDTRTHDDGPSHEDDHPHTEPHG